MLGEGIDVPELNVLQLASPAGGKGRVKQRIGRLMRGQGRKVVIDYVDADPISAILGYARKRTYRRLKLRFVDLKEILS